MRWSEIILREGPLDDTHNTLARDYAGAVDNQHVTDYSNTSSRLNARLLGKGGFWGKARDQKTTQGMRDFIAAAQPLKSPLRVFSKTGSWNPFDDIENDVLHTTPFISATLDFEFAVRFGVLRHNERNIIIQFDLPAGYHRGAYIGHAAVSKDQREFVLEPDQDWLFTGKSDVKRGDKSFSIVKLRPKT